MTGYKSDILIHQGIFNIFFRNHVIWQTLEYQFDPFQKYSLLIQILLKVNFIQMKWIQNSPFDSVSSQNLRRNLIVCRNCLWNIVCRSSVQFSNRASDHSNESSESFWWCHSQSRFSDPLGDRKDNLDPNCDWKHWVIGNTENPV